MYDFFMYLMDQGTFTALFIILLVYTTKKAEERENKYINLIDNLINQRSEAHEEKVDIK